MRPAIREVTGVATRTTRCQPVSSFSNGHISLISRRNRGFDQVLKNYRDKFSSAT